MNAQPLVLIQENVLLEIKSDAPITSGQALKQRGQLFARSGQLLFLSTGRSGSLASGIIKAVLLAAFALLFFAPEKLPFDLSEEVIQLMIYVGFGVYAVIPRFFKKKPKNLTEENIEQLAFEGVVTRIYWREVLTAVPPGGSKASFLKSAELDLGYQKIALSLTENAYFQALSIIEGDAHFDAETNDGATEEFTGAIENLVQAFKK